MSSLDQKELRQLEGVKLDKRFVDKASGKDLLRPQLELLIGYVREGDTVVCHAMDRLARNLDDLRKLVVGLTERGVHVRFEKENLTFTGEDSPMSHLLLSVMGAFAQFERDLIRERQREGIALAKLREGAYTGRKHSLSPAQTKELCRRVAEGESKTTLAGEFRVNRQTLYRYIEGRGSDAAPNLTVNPVAPVPGSKRPPERKGRETTKRTRPGVQRSLHCRCGRGKVLAVGLCATCYTLKRQDEEYFGGLREQVLKRDGYCCRACGASGRGKHSIVVHHRVPGISRLSLMISLCPACHAIVSRTRVMRRHMPAILLELWREQHPDGHEQTSLSFESMGSAPTPMSLVF